MHLVLGSLEVALDMVVTFIESSGFVVIVECPEGGIGDSTFMCPRS